MPMKHWILASVLIAGVAGMASPLASMASESDGVGGDWSQIETIHDGESGNSYPVNSPYGTQVPGYTQYPGMQQQMPVQTMPQRPPGPLTRFFSNLMTPKADGRGGRRQNAMDQIDHKKDPPEPPRETVALPDPIVRLGKGVSYEGQDAPPGIYLLHLSDQGQTVELSLMREQQLLVSFPAERHGKQITAETLAPPPVVQATPSPTPAPTKRGRRQAAMSGDGHSKSPRSAENSVPKPVKLPPQATATVQLADDGQHIIFTYKFGTTEYISAPLAVNGAYRPSS